MKKVLFFACEVCGFKSTLIRYESDVTEEELLAKVQELNNDPDVDVTEQLPFPTPYPWIKWVAAVGVK